LRATWSANCSCLATFFFSDFIFASAATFWPTSQWAIHFRKHTFINIRSEFLGSGVDLLSLGRQTHDRTLVDHTWVTIKSSGAQLSVIPLMWSNPFNMLANNSSNSS
jgi:hypothetical protein